MGEADGIKSGYPAVQRQLVEILVDPDKQLYHGYTELAVSTPLEWRGLYLHANGVEVTSVDLTWAEPSKTAHVPLASDALPLLLPAFSPPPEQHDDPYRADYRHSTLMDLLPDVCVLLPRERMGAEVAIVKISFRSAQGGPAAGVHFFGGYAVAESLPQYAARWFPCVNLPGAMVTFSLRITVPSACIAVASGCLAKKTWASADQKWHEFHYDVSVPCAPCELGLAAGPFTVLPGSGAAEETLVTHFFPSDAKYANLLSQTVLFLPLPFAHYVKSVLGTAFPLPALSQVFLPPELARVPAFTRIGMQLLSADMIINARSVEQSQLARCTIALGIAQQWFGHFIRPATPDDAWLVEGLAGWLGEQYVKQYLGRTELAYQRWHHRQTICTLDTGDAPPLACGYSGETPWGPLNGTGMMEPSPLRNLKATAVVSMLERRAGEDLFRKHVATLVSAAAEGPPNAAPLDNDAAAAAAPGVEANTEIAATDSAGTRQAARNLDASSFLGELARAGDFKKEVPIFMHRWVYGRGVPHLTVGSVFHRRGCMLEVAIRQSGSKAAMDAALAAEREAQREGIGTGVIKVAVHEGSGLTVEHPVHVGVASMVLQELRVNPEVKKIPGKRGRKRKDEEERLAEMQAAMENAQHPVQYVRLDPGGEWLCSGRVLQSERMLKNQLRDSKDVVAQAEAVRGIGHLRVGVVSQGPIALLKGALEDTQLHCRVRIEAARALASLRDDAGMPLGLDILLSFYKKRYFEEGAEVVRPVTFTDVSEYMVAKAVVGAISIASAADGISVFDSILFLKLCSEQYCSAWGAYDDRGLLSAICTALGQLRTSAAEKELSEHISELAWVELERWLESEIAAPSPNYIVGVACLNAAVQLAGNGTCPPKTIQSIATTVRKYCLDGKAPLKLREAGHCAMARLLYGIRGFPAAVEFSIQCLSATDSVHLILAQAAWEEVAAIAATAAEGFNEESKVALARVAVSGDDPRVRHTAFIALRRLHHLPPTLFSPEQQAMRFEQSDAAEADQPVVSRFRLGVSAAAEPSPVQLDQQSMDAPSLLSSGAGDVSAGALPAISGVSLKIPLGQRASTSVVNPADGAVQQPTDALVTTGLLEGEAVLNEQVVSENVGQGASMAQTAAAPAPASTGEQGPSAVANKPGLIKLGINKNLI